MRLSFRLKLADFLEVNRTAWEQRMKALVVILLAIFMGLIGGWLVLFRGNQPDATVVFGAAGLFLVLGLCAPWIAGLGGWVKGPRSTVDVEITLDGVVIQARAKRIELGWNSFQRWYETTNLIVLVGCGDAIGIPRRSCEHSEWGTLRELLRTALGQPARN
jgi:hypothetical protein